MKTRITSRVAVITLLWLAAGCTTANGQEAERQRLQCLNNLKQLALASAIWATDHADAAPPDVLSMRNEIATSEVLVCPADPGRRPTRNWTTFTTNDLSYEFVRPSATNTGPQQVVFRCPFHGSVALLDGTVEQRSAPPAAAAPGRPAPAIGSESINRESQVLQRDLQDKDPGVRRAAVEKLARRLGEGSQILLTPRKELLDQYLATQNTCAGLLAGLLKDEDEQVRMCAMSALALCGPAAKVALPRLLEVLQGTDLNLKLVAVGTLGNLGTNAVAAVPELEKTLATSADLNLQVQAMHALGSMGAHAVTAVPVLERRLNTSTGLGRPAAALALWKITGRAAPVVPALIEALEIKGTNAADAWPSMLAATTLGEIGPEAKAAVPALSRLLQANDPLTRRAATAALVRISPDTPGIADALAAELQDKSPSARPWLTQKALRELGARSVPVLMRVADDPSPVVRRLAIETLGSIGEPAGEAAPVLATKLQDPDEWVRRAAANALGQMGAAAKPAVPQLRATLQDTSGTVRAAAAIALVRVDAPALEAIPTLVAAISRLEPREETAYSQACNAAPEISPAAVPAMLEFVKAVPAAGASSWDQEKTWRLRMGAIDLLRRMGSNGKSAVPALRQLSNQPGNESWRREITEALRQIE